VSNSSLIKFGSSVLSCSPRTVERIIFPQGVNCAWWLCVVQSEAYYSSDCVAKPAWSTLLRHCFHCCVSVCKTKLKAATSTTNVCMMTGIGFRQACSVIEIWRHGLLPNRLITSFCRYLPCFCSKLTDDYNFWFLYRRLNGMKRTCNTRRQHCPSRKLSLSSNELWRGNMSSILLQRNRSTLRTSITRKGMINYRIGPTSDRIKPYRTASDNVAPRRIWTAHLESWSLGPRSDRKWPLDIHSHLKNFRVLITQTHSQSSCDLTDPRGWNFFWKLAPTRTPDLNRPTRREI